MSFKVNVRKNRRKIRTPDACRHKRSGVANGAKRFRHPEADYTAARGSRPRTFLATGLWTLILSCHQHEEMKTS